MRRTTTYCGSAIVERYILCVNAHTTSGGRLALCGAAWCSHRGGDRPTNGMYSPSRGSSRGDHVPAQLPEEYRQKTRGPHPNKSAAALGIQRLALHRLDAHNFRQVLFQDPLDAVGESEL